MSILRLCLFSIHQLQIVDIIFSVAVAADLLMSNQIWCSLPRGGWRKRGCLPVPDASHPLILCHRIAIRPAQSECTRNECQRYYINQEIKSL